MEKILSNRTLAIIKPDAVANGHTGKIIDHIINAGFKIKAMKMIHYKCISPSGRSVTQ